MGFIFNIIILYFVMKFLFRYLMGESGEKSTYTSGNYSNSNFEDALLRVLAGAMKADGRVTKPELNVVKRVLVAQFGEEGAQSALLRLRDILKTDFDIRMAAMHIGSMVSYSDRLRIAEILCQIAEADGIITDSEVTTIVNMSYYMGLSTADTQHIASRLHVNGNSRGYGYGQQGNYYGGTSNSPTQGLTAAYATLGINENATNEEVKNAYRSLVKKYHPDRYATQSQEEQDKAAEKFKEVQDAYEKIKAARGV